MENEPYKELAWQGPFEHLNHSTVLLNTRAGACTHTHTHVCTHTHVRAHTQPKICGEF